ncbi:terminase large subunit domain-containing protein [Mycolicibacterium neoaurum]|uniref:terminase large subunit domain-containing protein n=1 Tax=Mycolicibacterium neoaurum TaxID=1795 RepID=UPI001F15D7B4|nr:terminase large subunit [Mycolicibacterium neoaurum]
MSDRFRHFAFQYLRFADGTPMVLRQWQVDLVASVWDSTPRPRLAAWALARGNGKSSLAAAMAVFVLMTGGHDVSVDVVAVDERQAGIVFGIAAKFIARHPELSERVQVYRDRLVYPGTESEMTCLPGTAAALEGRNPDLCICDEGGRIDPEVYEVVALASGKRQASTVLLIGTPGPRVDNVLARFRQHHQEHPEDESQVYREIGAAGFEHHPTDCEHCWALANPALDDFLYRDALAALQPPKMPEPHFRRARLIQWVTDVEDPFTTTEVWDPLSTGETVPDGAPVVIALDGSHTRDHTALLIGTVAAVPHFHPLAVFTPEDSPTGRIDVLAVENAIREACRRYQVRELVADPFRWNRTLQVLASEGITVIEFAHSPSRLTKATTDLHTAIVNGQLSHSGDPTLRAHVLAASVIEHDGGLRLGKASRSRHAPKIDLAACLVMAHSRASWLASQKPKRARVIGI